MTLSPLVRRLSIVAAALAVVPISAQRTSAQPVVTNIFSTPGTRHS